jgi:CheY-like chemotaxis protein
MPVMNGHESTRAIRALEREREREYHTSANTANSANVKSPVSPTFWKASKRGTPPKPALIIALTGLSSIKDQEEAFRSGVDLFLTKPVSFKEVGSALEDWEQGRIYDHEMGGMVCR